MEPYSLIGTLIVGLIAGWIVGMIKIGKGFGLVGNLIIGVLGAFVGWAIFFYGLGIAGGGWIWSIFSAVIGAFVLLFLVKFLRQKGVI
jgi:uncharacterized membrane protein YeaQ/YmgE (transglycosylase-associated protein family)